MGAFGNIGRSYWRKIVVTVVISLAVPLGLLSPPGAATAATTAQNTPVAANLGSYGGLWIGEMASKGTVYSGPDSASKVVKSWWAGRRLLLYEEIYGYDHNIWWRVSEPPEAPMYVLASRVRKVMPVSFQPVRFGGKWVSVSISQQVVTAYENGTVVKITLTSTGTTKNPTNLGVQRITWRLLKKDMQGGSRATGDYYYLKDVPYPQFFNSTGEALHGTYWHDNFGRRMSHGCVNLSTPMAGWFYGWASLGTIVYVHN